MRDLLSEGLALYRVNREAERDVAGAFAELEQAESLLGDHAGLRLHGLRVLDAGCGQHPTRLAWFAARGNRVVGMDLDVVVHGLDPLGFARMVRLNGGRRAGKTLARKALGVDRRLRRELGRRLAIGRLPRFEVHQGDVTHMPFPDRSFDLVHSRSVLQYPRDPARALAEIARVLRPAGAAYLLVHLHTTPFGAGDPRVWASEGEGYEPWQHLRGDGGLRANAETNGLRLADWRLLLADAMPGFHMEVLPTSHRGRLEPLARELRFRGDLRDYSLEELLAKGFVAVWRKPEGRFRLGARERPMVRGA